jgi:acyl-CoA thioesterase-1
MLKRWGFVVVFTLLCGCGSPKPAEPAAPKAEARPTPAPDARPVIVAFGDSLTAGQGLEPGQSFPDLLQAELDRQGRRYHVVNQGISGDTTDGGLARVGQALALRPRVVILELGANDGLRGLPLENTRANLERMIAAFQAGGARVLLCGMTLPRNYGPDYIRRFEAIYADLARAHKTALLPFLLEGVATEPKLMQPDGLHPTAEGTRRVSANVAGPLVRLLD